MKPFENLVIAIDGPAASGKSTVARRIAQELGNVFVSSGLMYRAFTWWTLENKVDPNDAEAVNALLEETHFQFGIKDSEGTVAVNQHVLSDKELNLAAVNAYVSFIAANATVRVRLVNEQRRYALESGVVMEGRDIGTVVFPDADFKFYIDASPEVRAQRRLAQGITDPIDERDKIDSTRKASPLTVATDAIVMDSSHASVDEVVAQVLAVIRGDAA